MTDVIALPQRIVNRRIIVLKSRLDSTGARLLGEKVKRKFFVRFGFLMPKPEEIQLISAAKYYEPYVFVGGKYAIDYCKKHVYPINVDENVREVGFLDRKFKPEPLNQLSHSAHKVIKLNGVAYFHHEDEAFLILDKIGREIELEQLPCAPSEEQTVEELAKAGMKFGEVKISLEEEIESLRSRIANRPLDVGEVIREMFEVNERAIIYCPVYQLEFMNVKTGKEAIAKIDGNTGKTMLAEFTERFSMKDFIEARIEDTPPIDEKSVEDEPDVPESMSIKDSVNSLEETDTFSNKVAGPPPASISEVEENIAFPAKVAGEVFHAGDNVTVGGDLEIPSGTIVYEALEVKGCLKIGADCQILGKAKALRDIVIGANTKIEGDVVSGGNVIIGPDSVMHGSVESIGHVEIGVNAVIEGDLHSKSVVLNPFARVHAR